MDNIESLINDLKSVNEYYLYGKYDHNFNDLLIRYAENSNKILQSNKDFVITGVQSMMADTSVIDPYTTEEVYLLKLLGFCHYLLRGNDVLEQYRKYKILETYYRKQ